LAYLRDVERFGSKAEAGKVTDLLRYRGDIDGLRAIAVLPVVLYHTSFPGLTGGYVGVDVFFVISGFLMASLIMSEIDQGTFNLLHFYERRIRRIFPALFAVIAVSAVAAWLLFMPIQFQYFSRSAIAAALFSSNVLFWLQSGYFDMEAQLKPLLHTWSLAVEEQFYIIFPLLLIFLSKLGRQWIAPALCVLLVASLGMGVFKVESWPIATFYLAPFRFWELLFGAFLALGLLPRFKLPVLSQLSAFLGIVLIGWAILTYDEHTTFPGLSPLIPCIGAALVIHARAETGPIGRLLRAPPLIFVGLISYSLYLWHWPLIVFTRYIFGPQFSAVESAIIVFASLILATLSWRFIEQPFRGRRSRIGRKALFVSAAVAVSGAVTFGAIVTLERGLPERLPITAQRIYEASYDIGRFASENCFLDSEEKGELRFGALCTMGNLGSELRFLVWGDSHAAAMAPAINRAARQSNHLGLFVGRASCPPLLDFDPGESNQPYLLDIDFGETKHRPLLHFQFGESQRLSIEHCREHNAAVIDFIAAHRIPVVFMIAVWPKYVHRAELPNQGVFFDPSHSATLENWSAPVAQSLDRTLAKLSRIGTRAVLVMGVPEMGYHVPEALAKAAMTGTSASVEPSSASVRKRQALARSVLETYAANYNATIIDPLPAFCDKTRCYAQRNGIVLYQDEEHLSSAGAKSISHIYRSYFQSLR
jgi:peptidoglycan/LPS O-acetylase OafA/YrhL